MSTAGVNHDDALLSQDGTEPHADPAADASADRAERGAAPRHGLADGSEEIQETHLHTLCDPRPGNCIVMASGTNGRSFLFAVPWKPAGERQLRICAPPDYM
jgi:hypothetical protein